MVDESALGFNPYSLAVTVRVSRRYSRSSFSLDEGMVMPAGYVSECDSSSKLFLGKRKEVMGLCDRGMRLFLFVCYELESGKAFVVVNRKRFMKEAGIRSVNTFKAAVNDLCRLGMISLTDARDVFWVNPDYFFRGSRVNAFPDRVRVKYQEK